LRSGVFFDVETVFLNIIEITYIAGIITLLFVCCMLRCN